MNFPTKYWQQCDDGRIQCDVCPRECRLKEGQEGMCYVRKRVGDEIVLTSYGRSSGFCIDPIEKKPLNHFLPGTPVLSFGTAGCNLGCRFCQNWDISKARETDKLTDQASPEKIAAAAKETNCRSVAYTYNDPVIFMEYAIDIAQACHEVDIKSVAVSAGYINDEPRREFFKYMDAANIDLKGFTERFYKKICLSELAPVLETLIYLKHETSVWFEITTLLIPGENDSEKELNEMTEWIVDKLGTDVPIHFSAFHPDFKMQDIPRTPHSTLIMARDIALKNGIEYAYVGNVHDFDRESSYCPNCDELLIGRDWYVLSDWNMENGSCKFCQTKIPGVFEDSPGTWGSKRMRVKMS